jgi:hypothetical protein
LGGLVIVVLLVLLSELGNDPGGTTAAEADAQAADNDGTNDSNDDPLDDGTNSLEEGIEVNIILGDGGVFNVENSGVSGKGSLSDDDGIGVITSVSDEVFTLQVLAQSSDVQFEVAVFFSGPGVVDDKVIGGEDDLLGIINNDGQVSELTGLDLVFALGGSVDLFALGDFVNSFEDFVIDSLGETVGLGVDIEDNLKGSFVFKFQDVDGLSRGFPVTISLDGPSLFDESGAGNVFLSIRESDVKGGTVEVQPEVLGAVDEVRLGSAFETESPDTFSILEHSSVNLISFGITADSLDSSGFLVEGP